jgi:FtsZ-binding cell division protein ZapB
MIKFVKILLALVYGELFGDVMVDTLNFPFHEVFQGKDVWIKFDRFHRLFATSNTKGGYIVTGKISRAKFLKLALSLTFRGKFSLRGGITVKMNGVKVFKNGILNTLLAHSGRVMMTTEEYKSYRGVMDMLNKKNKQLMQDVGFLNERVQSQDGLLGAFSVQHRELTDEVAGLHDELKETEQKLSQTKQKLSKTTKELRQTKERVKALEVQVNALCDKEGVWSAEQFLDRMIPPKNE